MRTPAHWNNCRGRFDHWALDAVSLNSKTACPRCESLSDATKALAAATIAACWFAPTAIADGDGPTLACAAGLTAGDGPLEAIAAGLLAGDETGAPGAAETGLAGAAVGFAGAVGAAGALVGAAAGDAQPMSTASATPSSARASLC